MGSHGYCALGSNRGFFDPFGKPTIDSRNESIVATPAIFIGGGELEKVRGHLYVMFVRIVLETRINISKRQKNKRNRLQKEKIFLKYESTMPF